MAQGPDIGMDIAELKRMLRLAANEPMNCAVGVGPDSGLIMLHKSKAPKALQKEMLGKFPKNKGTRFGTVAYQEDNDLLVFTINRIAPGLEKGLVKALKGTGYNKLDFRFSESDDDEAEAGAEAGTETGDTAPPDTDAPPTDPELLTKKLGDLIKQIGASANGDAGRLAALKTAAVAANAALKGGDLQTAALSIETLEGLIGQPSPPGGTSPTTSPAAVQKSRALWDAAQKRVFSEITAFKKAVATEFDGDPEQKKVMDALARLDAITTRLDTKLLDALDSLIQEPDASQHPRLNKQVRDVLDDYDSFVQGDDLIQKMSGDTPFGLKLSVGPTMVVTLKALKATLH